MNKVIIISIDGVLNNAESMTTSVTLETDLVLLVQSIVDETKAKVYLFDKDATNTHRTILKMLGLKYGLAGVITKTAGIKPLLKSKYVIITSDVSLRNQKNVVLTNFNMGIQVSDVRKSIQILNGY